MQTSKKVQKSTETDDDSSTNEHPHEGDSNPEEECQLSKQFIRSNEVKKQQIYEESDSEDDEKQRQVTVDSPKSDWSNSRVISLSQMAERIGPMLQKAVLKIENQSKATKPETQESSHLKKKVSNSSSQSNKRMLRSNDISGLQNQFLAKRREKKFRQLAFSPVVSVKKFKEEESATQVGQTDELHQRLKNTQKKPRKGKWKTLKPCKSEKFECGINSQILPNTQSKRSQSCSSNSASEPKSADRKNVETD